MELSLLVYQRFVHINSHNVRNEHIVRSKRDYVGHTALKGHGRLGNKRTRDLVCCLFPKLILLKLINVSPAVTKFLREDGKFTVVYCGTPDTQHTYTEGFAFLNETRKQQFIALLSEAGALPIYLPSENELCLRAGYLDDGRMLAAIFNLGYDPEEETVLYLEKEPTAITYLNENGEEIPVSFTKNEEGFYVMPVSCEPLYPTVLLIK